MNPSRERQHVIEGQKLIGEDCRLHSLHNCFCILASSLLREIFRRRIYPQGRRVDIEQLSPFRAIGNSANDKSDEGELSETTRSLPRFCAYFKLSLTTRS